jgi:hypothetical protein
MNPLLSGAVRGLVALAGLVAVAPALRAQTTLFTLVGDAGEGHGTAVDSVADVDGDGFDDLVIGFPAADEGGVLRGRVEVRSGRTLALLFQFSGDADFDQLGHVVAAVGDVDADGTEDVGAGTVGGNYARVWSGDDGMVLHTFTTAQPGDLLGKSIDGAGDVDDDGFDDVIVGTNRLLVFAPGFARVYSGQTGGTLYTFDGDAPLDGFGRAVAGGGDVDDDGYPDLLVGGPQLDGNGSDSGGARVFSGFDGTELHDLVGDASNDFFGASVDFAGDVDVDGFDDFVVGAPGCGVVALCPTLPGYARVFSGFDGTELFTRSGSSAFERLGIAVAGAGDVDGDGRADVLVGSIRADVRGGADSGRVELVSGATEQVIFSATGDASGDELGGVVRGRGDLNKDGIPDVLMGSRAGYLRAQSIALGRSTSSISLGSGGVQFLSAVAGPDFALAPAAIFGTLEGTTPGLAVGSVVLPLNLGGLNPVSGNLLTQAVFLALATGDNAFLEGLVAPSASALPIRVGAGFLDARGEARLAVRIPPGSFPALAGATVHHAFLAFDATKQKAVFVSNTAALDLVP